MTTRAEATIVINARDDASTVMARLEARMQSLSAPALRVQNMFGRTMNLTGLDQVHNRLGQLGQRLSHLPVMGAVFAAGGLAAVTSGLIRNSVAAHEAVGKIDDLSQKYKVSAEALQVLGEIGADSGVPMEAVASSMGKLQIKIAEALGGSKEAVQAFADAGINVDQIRKDGGKVEAVFARLAGEIAARKDEAADPFKMASMRALLGKSGTEMLPIAELGAEQYGKTAALMRSQGRLLEGALFKNAAGIDDAWGQTMRNLTGKVRLAGLQMGPALTAIGTSLDKLMGSQTQPQGAQAIEQATMQPPDGVQKVMAVFARLGDTIGEVTPRIIEAVPKIVAGLDSVLTTLDKVGKYIGWEKLLMGGMLLIVAPFAASAVSLIASIGGLGVSIAAVVARVAMLTAAPLIGWITTTAAGLTALGFSGAAAWALVLGPVVVVGAAIAGLAYLIYANWDGISSFLGGVWDGFMQGMAPVVPAIDAVVGAVKDVWSWVTQLFGATGDSAKGLQDWSNAGQLAGNVIATVFKTILAPVLAVIDAIKLVAASIDFLGGKEFNFKSSVASVISPPAALALPVQALTNYTNPKPLTSAQKALMLAPDTTLPMLAQRSQSTPPRLASLAAGADPFNTSPRRVDVGGKLEIRITADGRPQVERVQSNNPAFTIDAQAGGMYR